MIYYRAVAFRCVCFFVSVYVFFLSCLDGRSRPSFSFSVFPFSLFSKMHLSRVSCHLSPLLFLLVNYRTIASQPSFLRVYVSSLLRRFYFLHLLKHSYLSSLSSSLLIWSISVFLFASSQLAVSQILGHLPIQICIYGYSYGYLQYTYIHSAVMKHAYTAGNIEVRSM